MNCGGAPVSVSFRLLPQDHTDRLPICACLPGGAQVIGIAATDGAGGFEIANINNFDVLDVENVNSFVFFLT